MQGASHTESFSQVFWTAISAIQHVSKASRVFGSFCGSVPPRAAEAQRRCVQALTVNFKFNALMGFPGTKTISSQRSKVLALRSEAGNHRSD